MPKKTEKKDDRKKVARAVSVGRVEGQLDLTSRSEEQSVERALETAVPRAASTPMGGVIPRAYLAQDSQGILYVANPPRPGFFRRIWNWLWGEDSSGFPVD